VIEDYLDREAELKLTLWDPSTQLRYRSKRQPEREPAR
jgi:hypothetical protein